MDYKTSGVDIEAGYKSVELMKKHIAKNNATRGFGGLGGFSGAFSMENSKIWKNLHWFQEQTDVEPR